MRKTGKEEVAERERRCGVGFVIRQMAGRKGGKEEIDGRKGKIQKRREMASKKLGIGREERKEMKGNRRSRLMEEIERKKEIENRRKRAV